MGDRIAIHAPASVHLSTLTKVQHDAERREQLAIEGLKAMCRFIKLMIGFLGVILIFALEGHADLGAVPWIGDFQLRARLTLGPS